MSAVILPDWSDHALSSTVDACTSAHFRCLSAACSRYSEEADFRRYSIRHATALFTLLCAGSLSVSAQDTAPAKPNPAPDTLIFANGEQLSGALEKADSKGITFKSPMAGELTVKWENIKELRSDKKFALLTAGQKLTRKTAPAVVPEGPIAINGKELIVATATGPVTIASR